MDFFYKTFLLLYSNILVHHTKKIYDWVSLVVVIQNQSSYVEGPCMTLLENWLITHTHAHTIPCIEAACSHVDLLVTGEYLPQLRLSTQVITRPAFSLEFSNTYDTLSAECLSRLLLIDLVWTPAVPPGLSSLAVSGMFLPSFWGFLETHWFN